MYTLDIFEDKNLFLKVKIDFIKKETTIIERNKNILLNSIFDNDFSYERIISFLKFRIKNFDRNNIEYLIDYIKENECKLFDDNIIVKIN